jgi:hypothetical protein
VACEAHTKREEESPAPEFADRVMRFLDESGRSARVGMARPWLRVMATGTAARRSRMSEGAGDCSGLVRHAASGPQLIANERGIGFDSPVQLGRPPHKFPKPLYMIDCYRDSWGIDVKTPVQFQNTNVVYRMESRVMI